MLEHPVLLVAQHTSLLDLLGQHADLLKVPGCFREEAPKRSTLLFVEGIPLVACQPFKPVERTHPLRGGVLQVMHRLLTGSASVQIIVIQAAVTGVLIVLQGSYLQGEGGEDRRGRGEGGVGEKRPRKGGPQLRYAFQGHPGHTSRQNDSGGTGFLFTARASLVVMIVVKRCCVRYPDRHDRFPFSPYTLQQPTCYKVGRFVRGQQSIFDE